MKKFLQLAFRNVFRNRRRTLMSLIVVAGGVTGLLLVGGFFGYMFWALQESTIRNGLGHLQIFNAAQFEREETKALENGLDDYKGIIAAAMKTPHVKGAAPRIQFYGMISNGSKSSVYMATAVDPVQERRLQFSTRISAGKDLDEQSGGRNEVLLGSGLAKSLQAVPGSGLTVMAITADGALNGVDVEVKGIVNSGFKEIDDRMLRITLDSAQALLQSDRVSSLVVGLDATRNTDRTYAALAPQLSSVGRPIVIRKWIELATYYRQVRLLFSGIFIFLGVIVFFMVVMSTANTLMAAMFERTREIGAMLAMGTPQSWLIGLFLLEAIFIGLLGAVAGVAGGNLLGLALNRASITLPPPPGNTSGLPLKVLHDPTLMVGASLLVMLTLALASILPAVRGARLRIVEALAHV
jgi:putative ABC transport system permease protein